MPPVLASAPSSAAARPAPGELLEGYLSSLTARGAGNSSFLTGARAFLKRWPDLRAWEQAPLPVQLAVNPSTRPLLNYLMLAGELRPGYDYLLTRKMPALLREAPASTLGTQVATFLTATNELGYTTKVANGVTCQVGLRLLIQTGLPLTAFTDAHLAEFDDAITARELAHEQSLKHYRTALRASRTVLYHLGAPVTPVATKHATHLRWEWERHFAGVPEAIGRSLVAYCECAAGTRTRSTVSHMAGRLAHFARFVTTHDPALTSLAGLDRQRHLEPYLAAVAAARNRHTGAILSASERRSRILTVGRMIDDVIEWGWVEAPSRRLVFSRDVPRIPRPLPRYLPPDHDRRLAEALRASPQRLRADALLLLRATGMRIGELLDLEIDCVHEVPGSGTWLKVPLGKLDTERMVPIDEETLELIDRIVEHRSPGRPLPHSRSGKLADFLLTHQGRRLSVDTLRGELARVAEQAGLPPVTPHQLRHTYATALVNSGVSLQALMALPGHVSAGMSLRYGRLFDATVRADYEKALTLVKSRLGPVLGERTSLPLLDITGGADWREAPHLKTRLAAGYCVRTAAQGACSYANICEHCPSLRTDATFLPILAAQRTDAATLAADAKARGWDQEATRHQALVARIDQLMTRSETA